MTTPRSRLLALVLALVLTAAACGGGSDADGPPSSATQVPSTTADTDTEPNSEPATEPVEVVAAPVLTVDDPIAMVLRPEDDLVWLAERSGLVHTVEAQADGSLAVVGEPVLDISDRTKASGEQGLLGMAFSADGTELYVSYTNLDGDTRLVAYDVGTPPAHDGPLDADAGSVLFELGQPFPNHNGGHVLLGSDGLLWFGLGDGGAGDDPDNRAQNPDDLHGKILRFDLSKRNSDGSATPEIVITGVRNPWR
ncbi:MAG: PQQ-dependent sugar dehydrogenase, partial [Aquihabitans sp.]